MHSRPNFTEMQQLNIIVRSASKCDDIGAILLNDEDGALVGNFKEMTRKKLSVQYISSGCEKMNTSRGQNWLGV